ncbi:hypothetical protein J31TS4_27940 [Paenibacillus sp. J31TS4]|uniref:hypothetical protein n=1 Tax=Paenibacillus sp. J31TS4 TaxID=2807195 RepID=UPI001B0017AF|nr:hypothetical protein [Paenibacillus sp. J31TS4]GIP39514.1 hypothetical protein J31TS4_27940 [Paenibacillus sp. J31TS4]
MNADEDGLPFPASPSALVIPGFWAVFTMIGFTVSCRWVLKYDAAKKQWRSGELSITKKRQKIDVIVKSAVGPAFICYLKSSEEEAAVVNDV